MRRRRTPEIIGGRVNADGSVAGGTGNFQVQKDGAGLYLVMLPRGFKLKSVTATPYVAASAFCATTNHNDYWFYVRVFAWNTAATAGDAAFNFIAIGD